MKTLFKDSQKLKESGDFTNYSMQDFYSNLQKNLSSKTDVAIEKTLSQSGYKLYRKQYAQLKSAEKELISSANKYIQTHGATGGFTRPIVNLWSLEEALRGGVQMVTNPAAAPVTLGKAFLIKGTASILDFWRNPDRKISEMFKLADEIKLKKSKPLTDAQVFMPSIMSTFGAVQNKE
jgi:hypothetical protein